MEVEQIDLVQERGLAGQHHVRKALCSAKPRTSKLRRCKEGTGMQAHCWSFQTLNINQAYSMVQMGCKVHEAYNIVHMGWKACKCTKGLRHSADGLEDVR